MTMTSKHHKQNRKNTKPTRRSFTIAEKDRILAELDNAPTPQDRTHTMRREGLYHSLVARWPIQAEMHNGTEDPNTKRSAAKTAEQKRIHQLERQLRTSEEKRRVQEEVIDVLGKTHVLLEKLSKSADTDTP